ncbi:MAG: NADH-quinone oxidoreductase subunit D [Chlamydiales bacterium]|jgi:NADH-quinone oxidoreductase subunit D
MTETQTFEYSAFSTDGFDPDDPLCGELMKLNIGPQHPATHGVLRLLVTLDGETLRSCVPDVGYLHRGKEKACESLGWRKFFPHTDRLDYVQPFMNNIGYALALEKLAGVEVPQRGQELRVLLMELSRIMAHLIYVGTTSIDLGAVSMFFYTFREREKIYDLLDAYSGHRMNNTYIRLGGVYADMDDDLLRSIGAWVRSFPERIDEYEALLTGNRIWHERNTGVGAITKDEALAWSLSGPILRASGVEWDLRKQQPYCGYETYDFEIPIGTNGDCFDRYLVRIEEMRQSVKICLQAIERLQASRGQEFLTDDRRYVLPPKERIDKSMEELIFQFKVVTDMALPKGEAYTAIESSKGELGYFLASDGTSDPVRCHIRAPGLMNVQVIPKLVEGRLLSDLIAVIGSLDFVMGEVDR